MLHKILYFTSECQVVLTDVLILGWLDVDGQSFTPIGLHKKELPLIDYS
jgi:hypothetical protein